MSVATERLMQEASTSLDAGNYPEAVNLFLKVLESEPDNQEACLVLGSVYGEMGQLDDASALVSKAIELDPDDSAAHLTLGHILRSKGESERALENFRRAAECDSNNVEAQCTYGSMLHELGRIDEAAVCFEKAVEGDPDNVDARIMLGALQLKNGDLDRAADSYRAAIQLDPANADTAIALFRVLSSLDRINEAESVLRSAIESCGNEAKLFYFLSLNLLGQGRHGEALEYSGAALDLSPENDDYTILQAHIYERKGEPDQSLELLRPLLEADEVKVEAALAFARLAPVLGLKQEAGLLLDKVSNHPLTEKQTKDIEQARSELERQG